MARLTKSKVGLGIFAVFSVVAVSAVASMLSTPSSVGAPKAEAPSSRAAVNALSDTCIMSLRFIFGSNKWTWSKV